MRRPALTAALAALPLVLVDLLSKRAVRASLEPGETVAVLEGVLYLTHQQNTGVAFGLLRDLPEGVRLPLLLLVAAAGTVFLLVVLAPIPDLTVRIATVLVLGGAVGNALDRAADGAVTDFLIVRYFPYVFNVADLAITVAGCLLLVHLLLPDRGSARDGAEERAA